MKLKLKMRSIFLLLLIVAIGLGATTSNAWAKNWVATYGGGTWTIAEADGVIGTNNISVTSTLLDQFYSSDDLYIIIDANSVNQAASLKTILGGKTYTPGLRTDDDWLSGAELVPQQLNKIWFVMDVSGTTGKTLTSSVDLTADNWLPELKIQVVHSMDQVIYVGSTPSPTGGYLKFTASSNIKQKTFCPLWSDNHATMVSSIPGINVLFSGGVVIDASGITVGEFTWNETSGAISNYILANSNAPEAGKVKIYVDGMTINNTYQLYSSTNASSRGIVVILNSSTASFIPSNITIVDGYSSTDAAHHAMIAIVKSGTTMPVPVSGWTIEGTEYTKFYTVYPTKEATFEPGTSIIKICGTTKNNPVLLSATDVSNAISKVKFANKQDVPTMGAAAIRPTVDLTINTGHIKFPADGNTDCPGTFIIDMPHTLNFILAGAAPTSLPTIEVQAPAANFVIKNLFTGADGQPPLIDGNLKVTSGTLTIASSSLDDDDIVMFAGQIDVADGANLQLDGSVILANPQTTFPTSSYATWAPAGNVIINGITIMASREVEDDYHYPNFTINNLKFVNGALLFAGENEDFTATIKNITKNIVPSQIFSSYSAEEIADELEDIASTIGINIINSLNGPNAGTYASVMTPIIGTIDLGLLISDLENLSKANLVFDADANVSGTPGLDFVNLLFLGGTSSLTSGGLSSGNTNFINDLQIGLVVSEVSNLTINDDLNCAVFINNINGVSDAPGTVTKITDSLSLTAAIVADGVNSLAGGFINTDDTKAPAINVYTAYIGTSAEAADVTFLARPTQLDWTYVYSPETYDGTVITLGDLRADWTTWSAANDETWGDRFMFILTSVLAVGNNVSNYAYYDYFHPAISNNNSILLLTGAHVDNNVIAKFNDLTIDVEAQVEWIYPLFAYELAATSTIGNVTVGTETTTLINNGNLVFRNLILTLSESYIKIPTIVGGIAGSGIYDFSQYNNGNSPNAFASHLPDWITDYPTTGLKALMYTPVASAPSGSSYTRLLPTLYYIATFDNVTIGGDNGDETTNLIGPYAYVDEDGAAVGFFAPAPTMDAESNVLIWADEVTVVNFGTTLTPATVGCAPGTATLIRGDNASNFGTKIDECLITPQPTEWQYAVAEDAGQGFADETLNITPFSTILVRAIDGDNPTAQIPMNINSFLVKPTLYVYDDGDWQEVVVDIDHNFGNDFIQLVDADGNYINATNGINTFPMHFDGTTDCAALSTGGSIGEMPNAPTPTIALNMLVFVNTFGSEITTAIANNSNLFKLEFPAYSVEVNGTIGDDAVAPKRANTAITIDFEINPLSISSIEPVVATEEGFVVQEDIYTGPNRDGNIYAPAPLFSQNFLTFRANYVEKMTPYTLYLLDEMSKNPFIWNNAGIKLLIALNADATITADPSGSPYPNPAYLYQNISQINTPIIITDDSFIFTLASKNRPSLTRNNPAMVKVDVKETGTSLVRRVPGIEAPSSYVSNGYSVRSAWTQYYNQPSNNGGMNVTWGSNKLTLTWLDTAYNGATEYNDATLENPSAVAIVRLNSTSSPSGVSATITSYTVDADHNVTATIEWTGPAAISRVDVAINAGAFRDKWGNLNSNNFLRRGDHNIKNNWTDSNANTIVIYNVIPHNTTPVSTGDFTFTSTVTNEALLPVNEFEDLNNTNNPLLVGRPTNNITGINALNRYGIRVRNVAYTYAPKDLPNFNDYFNLFSSTEKYAPASTGIFGTTTPPANNPLLNVNHLTVNDNNQSNIGHQGVYQLDFVIERRTVAVEYAGNLPTGTPIAFTQEYQGEDATISTTTAWAGLDMIVTITVNNANGFVSGLNYTIGNNAQEPMPAVLVSVVAGDGTDYVYTSRIPGAAIKDKVTLLPVYSTEALTATFTGYNECYSYQNDENTSKNPSSIKMTLNRHFVIPDDTKTIDWYIGMDITDATFNGEVVYTTAFDGLTVTSDIPTPTANGSVDLFFDVNGGKNAINPTKTTFNFQAVTDVTIAQTTSTSVNDPDAIYAYTITNGTNTVATAYAVKVNGGDPQLITVIEEAEDAKNFGVSRLGNIIYINGNYVDEDDNFLLNAGGSNSVNIKVIDDYCLAADSNFSITTTFATPEIVALNEDPFDIDDPTVLYLNDQEDLYVTLTFDRNLRNTALIGEYSDGGFGSQVTRPDQTTSPLELLAPPDGNWDYYVDPENLTQIILKLKPDTYNEDIVPAWTTKALNDSAEYMYGFWINKDLDGDYYPDQTNAPADGYNYQPIIRYRTFANVALSDNFSNQNSAPINFNSINYHAIAITDLDFAPYRAAGPASVKYYETLNPNNFVVYPLTFTIDEDDNDIMSAVTGNLFTTTPTQSGNWDGFKPNTQYTWELVYDAPITPFLLQPVAPEEEFVDAYGNFIDLNDSYFGGQFTASGVPVQVIANLRFNNEIVQPTDYANYDFMWRSGTTTYLAPLPGTINSNVDFRVYGGGSEGGNPVSTSTQAEKGYTNPLDEYVRIAGAEVNILNNPNNNLFIFTTTHTFPSTGTAIDWRGGGTANGIRLVIPSVAITGNVTLDWYLVGTPYDLTYTGNGSLDTSNVSGLIDANKAVFGTDVTFELNYGNGCYNTVTYSVDGTEDAWDIVDKPLSPDEDGVYTISGNDIKGIVTINIVYNEYTITFDLNDDDTYFPRDTVYPATSVDNITYTCPEIGETPFPADPTRPHFTFAGWTLAQSESDEPDEPDEPYIGYAAGTADEPNYVNLEDLDLPGNYTLVANWTPVEYIFTIVMNEGKLGNLIDEDGLEVSYNVTNKEDLIDANIDIVNALMGNPPNYIDGFTNPDREHYDFQGWYWNEEEIERTPADYNALITANTDITVSAEWEPTQYRLFVDLEGGTLGTYNQDIYVYFDVETHDEVLGNNYAWLYPLMMGTAPVKSGYTFTGWYCEQLERNISGNSPEDVDWLMTHIGDITVTAQWIQSHTITIFMDNGTFEYNNYDYPTNHPYISVDYLGDITITYTDLEEALEYDEHVYTLLSPILGVPEDTEDGLPVVQDPRRGIQDNQLYQENNNNGYSDYDLKDIYDFQGYWTNPISTSSNSSGNGTKLEGEDAIEAIEAAGDYDIYARWTPHEFLLTFDYDCGTLTQFGTVYTNNYHIPFTIEDISNRNALNTSAYWNIWVGTDPVRGTMQFLGWFDENVHIPNLDNHTTDNVFYGGVYYGTFPTNAPYVAGGNAATDEELAHAIPDASNGYMDACGPEGSEVAYRGLLINRSNLSQLNQIFGTMQGGASSGRMDDIYIRARWDVRYCVDFCEMEHHGTYTFNNHINDSAIGKPDFKTPQLITPTNNGPEAYVREGRTIPVTVTPNCGWHINDVLVTIGDHDTTYTNTNLTLGQPYTFEFIVDADDITPDECIEICPNYDSIPYHIYFVDNNSSSHNGWSGSCEADDPDEISTITYYVDDLNNNQIMWTVDGINWNSGSFEFKTPITDSCYNFAGWWHKDTETEFEVTDHDNGTTDCYTAVEATSIEEYLGIDFTACNLKDTTLYAKWTPKDLLATITVNPSYPADLFYCAEENELEPMKPSVTEIPFTVESECGEGEGYISFSVPESLENIYDDKGTWEFDGWYVTLNGEPVEYTKNIFCAELAKHQDKELDEYCSGFELTLVPHWTFVPANYKFQVCLDGGTISIPTALGATPDGNGNYGTTFNSTNWEAYRAQLLTLLSDIENPVKVIEDDDCACDYRFAGWFDKHGNEVTIETITEIDTWCELRGEALSEINANDKLCTYGNFDSDSSIYVYAKWTPTIRVKFDADAILCSECNGDVTIVGDYEPLCVTKGSKITEPETPTVTSGFEDQYTFDGWYDNSDFEGDPIDFDTYIVEECITLYARFTPNTYEFNTELTNISLFNLTPSADNLFDRNIQFCENITMGIVPGIQAANRIIAQRTNDNAILADLTYNTTDQKWYYTGTANLVATTTVTIYGFPSFVALKVPVAGCEVKSDIQIRNDQTVMYAINYNNLAVGDNNPNLDYYSQTMLPLALQNATRAGYTFDGWYLDAGFTSAIQTTIATGTTGTVTLYAKWTPITSTVTFDMQGHGTPITQYEHVAYNSTIVAPTPVPIANGYEFGGWYKEAGCTNAWDFDADVVTEDITLFAKWTIDNYFISYYDTDGSTPLLTPTEYNITSGDITLPIPTKTGYTFAGWFATTTPMPSETPIAIIAAGSTGPMTLFAQWTPIEYNISYENLYTATNDDNPVTYTIEDAITLAPPTNLPTYHQFNGWFDAATGGTPIPTIALGSTGNKTLYAQWTITVPTYDITINGVTANNGTVTGQVGNIPENTNANVTIAANDGYKIMGIEVDGYPITGFNTASWTFTGTMVADVIINVILEPVQYTIVYDANDYDITPPANTVYNVTTLNPALDAVPTAPLGYENGQWMTDAAGSTVATLPTITGHADVTTTVYAKYTPIEYTISYNNLNGATNDDNPDDYTIVTPTITLVAPGTRTGYVFEGWYDAAVGGNQVTTIALGSTSNKTLYAQWIQQFNITVESGIANGSVTLNPSTTTVNAGTDVELTFTPATSYELTSFQDNGTTVLAAALTNGVYTINNIDDDHDITNVVFTFVVSSLTTNSNLPNAILGNLTANSVRITIPWTAQTGTTGILVYVSTSAAAPATLPASLPAPTTTPVGAGWYYFENIHSTGLNVTGLNKATTYYVKAWSVDANNNEVDDTYDSKNIKTQRKETELTSFNGTFGISDVTPNPVANRAQFSVSADEAGTLNAYIVDLSGSTVLNIVTTDIEANGERTFQFDASNLASGMYTIIVNLNNDSVVKSFVIRK